MQLLRYDDQQIIVTDLDPIEDILNLILTLKSSGYTSDFLRELHGFSDSSEIKKTAKLITYHVNDFIGLAQQGFSGPSETSFLPLYYATLNLSKVFLLVLGKRKDLERNRWHGAKYFDSEMSRSFLNERVLIYENGSIPLLFESINGIRISRKNYVSLKEIYSNISSIRAEYEFVTKADPGYLRHTAIFIQDDLNGHYLRLNILDDCYKINTPSVKKIKAYPGLVISRDQGGAFFYKTKNQKGDFSKIKKRISNNIKRYLISDEYSDDSFNYLYNWVSYTPISGRQHIYNEELCIMLAYFHLSNVVRYNPEHLYKLIDSKYWSIIISLRKHGFYRYIKLMWGNINKNCFDVD